MMVTAMNHIGPLIFEASCQQAVHMYTNLTQH